MSYQCKDVWGRIYVHGPFRMSLENEGMHSINPPISFSYYFNFLFFSKILLFSSLKFPEKLGGMFRDFFRYITHDHMVMYSGYMLMAHALKQLLPAFMCTPPIDNNIQSSESFVKLLNLQCHSHIHHRPQSHYTSGIICLWSRKVCNINQIYIHTISWFHTLGHQPEYIPALICPCASYICPSSYKQGGH